MSQGNNNSRIDQAASAMMASASVALIMTPLDVIKVRQQVNSASKVGPLRILSSVAKQEGVKALWAGLAPRLALGCVFSAFYFPMYEALRDNIYRLGQKIPKDKMPANFEISHNLSASVGGGCARMISTIVTNPVEVATVRIQSNSKSNFMDVLWNKVLRDRKVYFSGVGQTMMRDVPFSMIYWGINEPLKNNVFSDFGPFLRSFLSGAVAGCVSAVVTHPFDVLKTKLQTGDKKVSWKQVVKKEGFGSLYAGIKPRCVRVSGSCAIMLGVYEKMKDVMKN